MSYDWLFAIEQQVRKNGCSHAVNVGEQLKYDLKMVPWKFGDSYNDFKIPILCRNDYKSLSLDRYYKISILTQIMVRCIKQIMSEDFKKLHSIKDYHLNLIERMHFNYYEDDDDDYNIGLEEQRPYGNSHVQHDILEALEESQIKEIREKAKKILDFMEEDDWDEFEKYDNFLWDIHNETINILIEFLKSDNYDWVEDFEIVDAYEIKLGKVTSRKHKLNNIK